jgi:YVTN family beta-propeller protein
LLSRAKSIYTLILLASSLVIGPLRGEAAPNAYVANTEHHLVSVIDTVDDTLLATIPVGAFPSQVAVTQDGARVYVTNAGTHDVSVIDTASNTEVAFVAVSDSPAALALTPDGTELYVLGAGGVLQVIDTALIGSATDPVVATLSFGTPGFNQDATSIAFLPDGTRAYALVSGSLRVIDTDSLAVLSSLDVGSAPSQVVLSPDGTLAYITNSFGFDMAVLEGQVVVVDTATDSVVSVIPLFTLPGSIVLTPDGGRAYVGIVSRLANGGEAMGFTPDQQVAVIDLATSIVTRWIRVPGAPAGIAITPDGSGVYVAIPSANAISVIDTATDTLALTIDVAPGPNGLAIGPSAAPAISFGTGFTESDPTTESQEATTDVALEPMTSPIEPNASDAATEAAAIADVSTSEPIGPAQVTVAPIVSDNFATPNVEAAPPAETSATVQTPTSTVSLGPDLHIVSVGSATRHDEHSVRVPLILGDAAGATSSIALTISIEGIVE